MIGFYVAGALITRLGFWGPLYYTIRNPQNSIGNFFSSYIRIFFVYVTRERWFLIVMHEGLEDFQVWDLYGFLL